jgi:ribosomal protein S18 acetylase RimI-like enzyme
VLAAAFRDDPLYAHIVPDPRERAISLRRLQGAVVRYCVAYGQVYTTADVRGVACWLTPGNTEVTLWRMLRTGLALPRAMLSFAPRVWDQFTDMVSHLERARRRSITSPHWHLWALGVAPAHQRQGIGSRLIAPVLAQSDDTGVPCYLETETERNVSFYRQRGFEVVGEEHVLAAGLPVWLMVRPPPHLRSSV